MLLLAAGLGLGIGPAAAAGSLGAESAAPPLPLVTSWLEQMFSYLDLLNQLLGGIAGSLSPDPNIAMSQVTSQYNAHGCPPNLTEVQKAGGRADVEALWALTSPGITAPNSTVIAFRRMLKQVYADFGGNPNLLN